MEKRLVLAFVLSFLVLLMWGRLFPQQTPTTPPDVAVEEKAGRPSERPSSVLPPSKPLASAPSAPAVSEQEIVLETDKFNVRFTNAGGCIKSIELREYAESLPVEGIVQLQGLDKQEFKLTGQTPTSVQYAFNDQDKRIIKTYELSADTYIIDINIEIENNEKMSSLDINQIQGFRMDVSRLDKKLSKGRDLSLIEHSGLINDKIWAKGNIVRYDSRQEKFNVGKFKTVTKTGTLKWIGLRDRYFAFILSPQFQSQGFQITNPNESLLEYYVTNLDNFSGNEYNFKVYYGPQRLHTLKEAGYHFDKIMRFSGWGLLDAVAKAIYFILNMIHRIIPSWGLCIIFLGVLIYGITYPLTLKSMASMKKMQALQPKIAQLKEKYKDNPQKLSKEQMELFKEHKINPMGGCLPIFLQMPVFIGFYQVLWRSVMLKGADFLWIKDLSEPDRLMTFAKEFPLIGKDLNILPLLMGVIMFFQQKISSKNMNVSDPTQASQQKMMMLFLPIMMVFIFYHAASGLTLYFTFFYLLTIFTQWRISKSKG